MLFLIVGDDNQAPTRNTKQHSNLTYDQYHSQKTKKQLISYLRKTKKNKMVRFTIISAQEMERRIPMGQKMTGLTAKKMNKMDILELMGYLPKELLIQILLGDDWWKPTHVPTELKVGGFKWDMVGSRLGANRYYDTLEATDRNIRAAIQIAMPFRDIPSTCPRCDGFKERSPSACFMRNGAHNDWYRQTHLKYERKLWEQDKKKFSEVPTKFTEKRVTMSGDGKAVGYKTAGMMLMGIPKKNSNGTKVRFKQGEYGFSINKMLARGYTKERWNFITTERSWEQYKKDYAQLGGGRWWPNHGEARLTREEFFTWKIIQERSARREW